MRHSLLTAIDNAATVTVVEHASFWDRDANGRRGDPHRVYSTVKLTTAQINDLRRSLWLTEDTTVPGVILKCIFNEHHYI